MNPQTRKRKLKPSGIDWIGDVPEGWIVTRFGYHAAIKANLVDVDDYGSFPQVSPENIEKNTGRLLAHGTVEDSGVISGNHLFKKGQILYSKIRPALNKVTIAPYPGLCCADMYPIETDEDTRFMVYIMLADCFVKQTETVANMRIKMPKINQDELSRIRIAMPPLDEQKRIAAKLDRLCGRVDELAANLTKEIAALQDYRKSLITECVTKGLNPKAKMKPSGVDWIGKIPAGWTVMRLKYTGWYRNGLTYKPENVCADGEGHLVLRSSNIQQGRLDFADTVYVDVEVPRELKVRVNDIIICSRNGSSDLIGKNAIVDVELDMTFGAFMMGYRPDAFCARYAYWLLNSHVFKYYLSSYATSTVNQLTGMDFGNMKVPLPSFDEQCRIAAYLDKRCAVIDAKIAERQRQLEKLAEYRSSAIYEYVTGKREVAA